MAKKEKKDKKPSTEQVNTMAEKQDAHAVKEQTKEHCKKMEKLEKLAKGAGLTEDNVIDLGDFFLNRMTLDEINGKTDATAPKKEAKGKNSKANGGKQPKSDSGKPSNEGKAKGKDKKGKDKKSGKKAK